MMSLLCKDIKYCKNIGTLNMAYLHAINIHVQTFLVIYSFVGMFAANSDYINLYSHFSM